MNGTQFSILENLLTQISSGLSQLIAAQAANNTGPILNQIAAGVAQLAVAENTGTQSIITELQKEAMATAADFNNVLAALQTLITVDATNVSALEAAIAAADQSIATLQANDAALTAIDPAAVNALIAAAAAASVPAVIPPLPTPPAPAPAEVKK